MPAEPVHRHVDSSKLDNDVGASREFRDVLLPFVDYLGAPAFVRTDSQRSAKVIQHDRRIREGFRERNYHRHLRMVLPRLEAETQVVQPGEALAYKSAGGLVCEFRTSGLASKPPPCRIPRKRSRSAPLFPSSTGTTASPTVNSPNPT